MRCLIEYQSSAVRNLSPVVLVVECQVIGKTVQIPDLQQAKHTLTDNGGVLLAGISVSRPQTPDGEK